jgi:hypothetical protein
MTRPEASFLDHHVAAKEPFAVSLDRRRQPRRLQDWIFGPDAHQHNTGDRALPAKDKIAKILVLGEQQSLLAQRERDNIRVAQTGSGFRDIEHIVTVCPQKHDQRRRDAFVREPAHLLAVNDVFVGEIVGGKPLRGKDII